MTSLRQRMTEDMQVRNLALNTQMSYVQQVSLFARHFNKSPDQLGPEDIRAYQVYLTNEKKLDSRHSAEALAKNLARHGIDVVLDKVDANGRRIDEVLEAYTVSHQVDVLVMGAYGHARWREFILGGATKSLLSKPPLPILFSH